MKIFLVLMMLFTLHAFGANLELNGGESAIIQSNVQTQVTCSGTSNSGGNSSQSATSKSCAKEDYSGNCVYFDETTIMGKYCVTGEVCNKENYSGNCVYFNIEAACGSKSCTVKKTCGKTDYSGNCVYFNQKVSCE